MTDFSFIDKDNPDRIYYRDHPNEGLIQHRPASVDGDDFCLRCGLPLHQCNCKSRRGV